MTEPTTTLTEVGIDQLLHAHGSGQERGWNDALEAAERAVKRCASTDTNGYVCEKGTAMNAIRALKRDTFSTRDALVTALIRVRDAKTQEEARTIAMGALQAS